MIDHLKTRNDDQDTIMNLFHYCEKNLKKDSRGNHHYVNYKDFKTNVKYQFRKIIRDKKLLGFMYVDISFSAHYIFNNSLHNGNDFTPTQSIKTIKNFFDLVGINRKELENFKIINLEFGVNIIPVGNAEDYINGTVFWGRKRFIIPTVKWVNNKITQTSLRKKIKVYAKGHQENFQDYGIDRNTIRVEVHSSKSDYIKTLGMYSVLDLLNVEKYKNLFQSLLDEWENVLLINKTLPNKYADEKYWNQILIDSNSNKNKNKFTLEKKKYYKNISLKNNLHHEIKCKIIDKLIFFSQCAFLPHETSINTEKIISAESNELQINGNNAHECEEPTKLCQVTALNISMQETQSRYLSNTELELYYNKEPEINYDMCMEYLTEEKISSELQTHNYCLSQNIHLLSPIFKTI